ncbi:MAG: SDR family oxidoreductase [Luteitalea sp.]|nr:SDR family oxidoreductase [Luteitalea sp.]
MTRDNSLSGKVAIVTGGSRGIGLATAKALVDRGAATVISALHEEPLSAARRALGDGRVEAVRADVQSPQDTARLVETAIRAFGGLDILVNNAGIGRFGDVADLSTDDWNLVVGTNLTGVFHCCHAAIPQMRQRGGGWIINISSLAGINAFKGGAAYCASKAGLDAFTEALMQEVRYDGIRVAVVAPGSVRTGFSGRDEKGADWKLAAEDVAQVILDLVEHPTRSLPSRVELRPSQPKKA